MAEVVVHFAIPAEPLRPFVSTYWEMEVTGEGVVEDMLHPEWANIRITLDVPWEFGPSAKALVPMVEGIIHGPTSHGTHVRGFASSAFGIGLLPTGWNRFWRAAASDYADQTRPLSDLMGSEAQSLIAGMCALPDFAARASFADATFLAILAKSQRTMFDDQVDALFQVLIDPASATVEQMTATLGLPQSRLARLSKRGFGFPPKLLLRRQRFLRMLGTLHARPYDEWNDFIDPQYVDQSHMIRDFQRFLGVAPSHYFAMKRPILAAAAKARAAMFGQPLQGLHAPARKGLTE
jgi:AraC-like DNA-binding protein